VAPADQLSPEDLARPCPGTDPRAMPGDSGAGGGSVDNAGGVVDLEILPCEPPIGEPVPLPEPMPTEPFEPPVRPDDLPSEDEARSIALDLLGATGVDTDDAEVTVEDGITEWFVTVEPRLGGLPAPGLSMYVGVGGEGEITMASGYLADADELGEYPLLDTTAALERLNEQYGGMMSATATLDPASAGDMAADAGAAEPAVDPAVDPSASPATEPDVVTTEPVPPPRDVGDDLPVLTVPPSTALPPDTIVPETTVPAPPPTDPGDEPTTTIPGDPGVTPIPAPPEVAVTDAELVLLMEVAWDGSGTYLVPGYRFTADDQSSPVVTAVVDDLVEPPPTDLPGDPAVDDGSGDGDAPVSDAPAEVPPVAPDTPVEQPADANNPDPRPAVQPDDATGG
jgi:hypothetical protein